MIPEVTEELIAEMAKRIDRLEHQASAMRVAMDNHDHDDAGRCRIRLWDAIKLDYSNMSQDISEYGKEPE